MFGTLMPLGPMGGHRRLETEFLTTIGDTVDRSTYTFSAQSLGEPHSLRRILVSVHGNFSSGRSLRDVIISGETAVIHHNPVPTGGVGVAWASSLVPAGLTGDVVVAFNATGLRCAIGLWRLVNAASAPIDQGFSTSSAGQFNLQVPAGGAVFAAQTAADGATGSVAGVAENYRNNYEFASWQVRGGFASELPEELRTVALPSVSSGVKVAAGLSWGAA